MLDPDDAKGAEDQDQQEFCNCDRTLHVDACTDMDEFSQLLSKVSTDVLWKVLMTYQQRLIAKALWEACNYGGRPKPGDFKHMGKKREYAEWVLKMDHRQQWNKSQKPVKL
jgi:hypothetical protein